MADFHTLMASLFIMLKQNTYILLRIEFLVVITTMIFLTMNLLDIFRRRSHSTAIRVVLKLLFGVSDSIVLYVMGAMQMAPFKNELFPVWVVVLISFRSGINFISAYGIHDTSGQEISEVLIMIKYLFAAFLNNTHGSKIAPPLWSLWILQVLMSLYRFCTCFLARVSFWHGQSSQILPEYMRIDQDHSNLNHMYGDPYTMIGYAYLVYGESKQIIKLQKPRYILYLDITRRKSLITLDKIWTSQCKLLRYDNSQGNSLKDMCLAFALSRLIRCRFVNVTQHRGSISMNQNLVRVTIFEEKDPKRAFGIIEMELAFLNDYLHTRYPMVFWNGLYSLSFDLLKSTLIIAFVSWLALDIRRVYKPPEGELAHVVKNINIDIIITWVLLFFMAFKEIWEMVTYFLSDWTRLLLVCACVKWNCRCIRNILTEKLIKCFFLNSKIADRWHGITDQYAFLQSYSDNPTIWNLVHRISIGAISKKDDGSELSNPINLPECVKPAVLSTLHSLDLRNDHLLKEIPSLRQGGLMEQYGWACLELPTCTHTILVWHIATSLCEVKLALDKKLSSVTNPGRLHAALSRVTNYCGCCCCSPQPYLVKESILNADMKTPYIVANSLSRYCAYLLVSKPDLLPDRYLAPKFIFQATVLHAREILKDCDSLESRYDRLISIAQHYDRPISTAQQTTQETATTIKQRGNILEQGAILGWDLISKKNEDERWKILGEVWTYLLVHIAPTWNASAHKICLESGGEFITHIWAMLWHLGIEKSSLWQEDESFENSAEANNIKSVVEKQQAGAELRNNQTKSQDHDKDEIGSSQESETGNFGRRQKEKEGTWRSEIEECRDPWDIMVRESYTQTYKPKEIHEESELRSEREVRSYAGLQGNEGKQGTRNVELTKQPKEGGVKEKSEAVQLEVLQTEFPRIQELKLLQKPKETMGKGKNKIEKEEPSITNSITMVTGRWSNAE